MLIEEWKKTEGELYNEMSTVKELQGTVEGFKVTLFQRQCGLTETKRLSLESNLCRAEATTIQRKQNRIIDQLHSLKKNIHSIRSLLPITRIK